MACETVQAAIEALRGEKRALQQDLQDAEPSTKAAIAHQIKRVDQQIEQQQGALQACLAANGLTHAVTIELGTFAAGADYFANTSAEWYEKVGGRFAKRGSVAVDSSALRASLAFRGVPPGKHRFCVRGTRRRLRWRSPVLEVSGDSTFEFAIIPVPFENTTLGSSQLEDGLPLPIRNDIPDLDEALTIKSADITIFSDYIDIDGEGTFAKGVDWTPLRSDLDFDYDFRLVPTLSTNPRRLVSVEPIGSIKVNFTNYATAFLASFVQAQMDEAIVDAIEGAVNDRIREAVRAATRAQFGDEANALISATVTHVGSTQTGTIDAPFFGPPIPQYSLVLALEVSVPSALLR
jgi:hypothetical protein